MKKGCWNAEEETCAQQVRSPFSVFDFHFCSLVAFTGDRDG